MEAMSTTLEDFNHHVTALANAESPSDVFKVLMEAGSLVAPRTAVFLVRRGLFLEIVPPVGWRRTPLGPQLHPAE